MKRIMVVLLVVIIGGLIILKAFDNYTLVKSVENNNYAIAMQMIDKGSDVDAYKYCIGIPAIFDMNPTSLVAACRKGNVEMVELLLNAGADASKRDKYTKAAPLHEALRMGGENRFELAKLLIENGADYNVDSVIPVSPLQEVLYVSSNDSEETIIEGFELFRFLMGNDVEMKLYRTNENVLTYAAHHRNYRAVEFLIENYYFDVDSYDDDHNTALIVATKASNVEMVDLLLRCGADVSKEDAAGKTAYDYAQISGNDEIVKLLEAST